MVKPIRLDLLIHTVEVETYSEPDTWGNTYEEKKTIEKVRVEPRRNLVTTKDNRQVTSNAILFHDATFSTPCDFELESKVIFNGQEMKIVSIQPFYDNQRLHHTEVGLI
ncbi:putative minor capsid protein [Facklamia sp. P13064]|uniref:putative minor capsid protein n=1 Tax=Facklamia sp. P13064 TaxID=3421953 RepID=UPI003D170859